MLSYAATPTRSLCLMPRKQSYDPSLLHCTRSMLSGEERCIKIATLQNIGTKQCNDCCTGAGPNVLSEQPAEMSHGMQFWQQHADLAVVTEQGKDQEQWVPEDTKHSLEKKTVHACSDLLLKTSLPWQRSCRVADPTVTTMRPVHSSSLVIATQIHEEYGMLKPSRAEQIRVVCCVHLSAS